MKVLVFNAGSSSLKFGLFETAPAEVHVLKGSFAHFRDGAAALRLSDAGGEVAETLPVADIGAAIARVPAILAARGLDGIAAIGHRIVHGGASFTAPLVLGAAEIAAVEALRPLAPLHLPANLEAVRVARATWPGLPQVAVFDTAFHATNPPRATTYAVPAAWRATGLRRYGFHGTSHRYVALRAAEALDEPLDRLQIVSCHLGNGASVCAIDRGLSVDSSMGMTPLEGLVMGTRSGDVDPGLFGHLHRTLGLAIPVIEAGLYGESGLRALAGTADMREVEARAGGGDEDARLALEVYAYRTRKYVGAYAAAMGGIDVLAFTGGIGENSASMRRRICDGLEFLGLRLDHDLNQAVRLRGREAPQIAAAGSRVRVIVTETAEQLMIARETAAALVPAAAARRAIPVAVSARHVHLEAATAAALFGPGATLHRQRELRQPGSFAAAEEVALVGPRGRIEGVRVLGPLRDRDQIEISRTDSFELGIDAPLRDSGDLAGTPRVVLEGPAGRVETGGLIVAARHIHTNPADAARLGLADGQRVAVQVGDGDRGLSFGHVLVRVTPQGFTEMHIDTDEANAAGIRVKGAGALVPMTRHAARILGP
ncbi:MAG: acetate/propionate family kinase [Rhodobacteraceae bacterium]|nr:acetate/propionate family kinase [Paracoccaceae bacterium]